MPCSILVTEEKLRHRGSSRSVLQNVILLFVTLLLFAVFNLRKGTQRVEPCVRGVISRVLLNISVNGRCCITQILIVPNSIQLGMRQGATT